MRRAYHQPSSREDALTPVEDRRPVHDGTDPGVTHRDVLPVEHDSDNGRFHSLPEDWLALHGDALFRYALLLVADAHRAEDLVQEVLLAALQARDRYSATASERTWLIAILRNKAIDQRRRDRLRSDGLREDDLVVEGSFTRFGKWRKPPGRWIPNPQGLLESEEFWEIFQECMGALPMALREAFTLRVVENLDAAETCRILEITSANLWTMLYRARERLRRCLEIKWFN